MPNKKYLLVIGGPTASGKTHFAIQLARHFQTEILSADSRQFYQEMNIGTAKPEPEELNQVPHHFINQLSIKNNYSVGRFEADALERLQQLYQKYDQVVLVGGSGLYIKALCEGLDPFPEVSEGVRQKLEQSYQEQGISALQDALSKVDPAYYATVDLNNPHRLIRALAVYHASGKPFSFFRQQNQSKRSFHPIYLQLQWPRAQLYHRIDQRVDQMVKSGLVKEAQQLLPYRKHTALQTVGYQELFDHFVGKCTLEEAIELIKRNSRRYAKRQLTWNRRDGFWKHFQSDDLEMALAYIEQAQFQGFSIQLQAESLPTNQPFLPSNLKIPGKYLNAFAKEQVVISLYKEYFSKTTCFSHFSHYQENLNPIFLKLFAHETALQVEDQPAYLIIPPALEPFFHKYGFQNVPLESIPGKIQSRWSALQFLGGQSILYKPSLVDN